MYFYITGYVLDKQHYYFIINNGDDDDEYCDRLANIVDNIIL